LVLVSLEIGKPEMPMVLFGQEVLLGGVFSLMAMEQVRKLFLFSIVGNQCLFGLECFIPSEAGAADNSQFSRKSEFTKQQNILDVSVKQE